LMTWKSVVQGVELPLCLVMRVVLQQGWGVGRANPYPWQGGVGTWIHAVF